MACLCISAIADVLNISDLAEIACSYIPKSKDIDMIGDYFATMPLGQIIQVKRPRRFRKHKNPLARPSEFSARLFIMQDSLRVSTRMQMYNWCTYKRHECIWDETYFHSIDEPYELNRFILTDSYVQSFKQVLGQEYSDCMKKLYELIDELMLKILDGFRHRRW